MGPKILIYDIETAPILGYVWTLWENNVGLNQIKSDWYILSYSAKWLGEKKIFYQDNRNAKNIEDDKKILKGIWKLIDEADIVITQNGKKFDEKKLNARFIIQGFQPPSSYKHIDTRQIAKSKFGFTSNKLEYMTDKLTKVKKSKHLKFPGFELWKACLDNKLAAWKEMEKYNKLDVTSLEELYKKFAPWDNKINFSIYYDKPIHVCSCGSRNVKLNGHSYTSVGKFQRWKCIRCGKEFKSAANQHNKKKRLSLLRKS